MSQVRQNYHADAENAVNQQINQCFHAEYSYLSLAFYFDRDDVALPNFDKFFKDLSNSKRQQGQQLMKFQNNRGGKVLLQTINKPVKDAWGSPTEAMLAAMEMEKALNTAFIGLHAIAENTHDAHMEDFVEEEFLEGEVECIKRLGDYLAQLKRAGPNLGEYLFDRETLE